MGNLEPYANVHVQKIVMQHKHDISNFIKLLPNSKCQYVHKNPQNVHMCIHHTFTQAKKTRKLFYFSPKNHARTMFFSDGEISPFSNKEIGEKKL